MPRPRYSRPTRELTLMQRAELKLGPSIPTYRDTGEYACEDIAAAYERLPRRGFATFAEMREVWRLYGAELMEEDPAGAWWAWERWSRVTINDLISQGGE